MKLDDALARKRSFNQVFASLYAADPAAGLAYFLNTCQTDSRQFFQSKTFCPPMRNRSEQLLRSYAHALTFQKNPVQALLIGDYLLKYLSDLGICDLIGLIAQIGNDLSSLTALSSEQRGADRKADRRRDDLLPFWQKFSPLLSEWGSIAPPLHPIIFQKKYADQGPLLEKSILHYLDIWSLDQISCFDQLPDRPLLICFDSAPTLLHSLSQRHWLTALLEKSDLCGFWVLDEELEPQMEIQKEFFLRFQDLKGPLAQWPQSFNHLSSETSDAMRRAGMLLRSKASSSQQAKERAEHLKLMREQNFALMSAILGWESLLAVGLARDSAQWFSASNAMSDDQSSLDLWIEQMLAKLLVIEVVAHRKENRRLKLIHVVSQLIDSGHSPTQLLRQLIESRNAHAFDVSIMSTERLTPRQGEYPQLERSSPSSFERGRASISWLSEKKIPIEFLNLNKRWSEGLLAMRDQIGKMRPDILVFHGPDLLHLYLARSFAKPLKVLFEHGTLPRFRGFDLAIASTEDAPLLFGEQLAKLATKVIALPFCSDRRAQWMPGAMSKANLGLEEGDFAAITISNHLVKRLSPQFCQTISSILRRCTKMHYALIGPVADMSALKKRFDSDVQSRIRFCGSSKSPANLARVADLYFNEFPWGGCLGILDALAAGCPVVAMYDEKGPAQGRYGGLLMGREFAVRSNDPNHYIELACRLYQEPLLYFQASQRAFTRYEGRSNSAAYVKAFEKILSEALLEHR